MTDKELTAIEKAAEASLAEGIFLHAWPKFDEKEKRRWVKTQATIIKRELEKAVPERGPIDPRDPNEIDWGYNACRKAIGLD